MVLGDMSERAVRRQGGDEIDRRDRARDAAPLAPPQRKHARKAIDSFDIPAQPLPEAQPRRLTASERKALRQRRQSTKTPPLPVAAPPQRMESRGGSRTLVAVGSMLIVGLTVITFGGGRLFSRVTDPTSEPTSVAPGGGVSTPSMGVPALASPDLGFAPDPGDATSAGATDRAPVVCIDAGHGGRTNRGRVPLAVNTYSWLDEASLVLQHAWDLEARLKQYGYTVAMTRRTDTAVNASEADVNGDGKTARDGASFGTLDDLQARIDICNEANADLLISMHINGFDRPTARGYETWFTKERPFGDQSWRFATLAYRALQNQLAPLGYVLPENEERGVLPDTTADVDTEHAQFKNFVLTGPAVEGKVDPSRMPGAIVETLFLTNDGDAAILASSEGRDAIVTAYEIAILQYFQEYPPE